MGRNQHTAPWLQFKGGINCLISRVVRVRSPVLCTLQRKAVGSNRRAEVVPTQAPRRKGGDVTDPPWGGSNRMRG
eukprot:3333477-Prymnesium_polylepis.1